METAVSAGRRTARQCGIRHHVRRYCAVRGLGIATTVHALDARTSTLLVVIIRLGRTVGVGPRCSAAAA